VSWASLAGSGSVGLSPTPSRFTGFTSGGGHLTWLAAGGLFVAPAGGAGAPISSSATFPVRMFLGETMLYVDNANETQLDLHELDTGAGAARLLAAQANYDFALSPSDPLAVYGTDVVPQGMQAGIYSAPLP
jgi:hypothetical protein